MRDVSVRVRRQWPSRRPSPLRVVVAVSLIAALPLGRAGGQTKAIAQKRRDAARLSAQIEAVGTRMSQLDEDYLAAQEDLVKIRKRLAAAMARESTVSNRLSTLRSAMHQRALSEFAHPSGSDVDVFDGTDSIGDIERRGVLRQQQLGKSADVADALAQAEQDLQQTTLDIRATQVRERKAAATIAKKRREADALSRRLDTLEASARGDLARLIVEEDARRAEAEAKAARAAATRAEAAARRAVESRRARAVSDAAAARREAERLRRRTGTPRSDRRAEVAVARRLPSADVAPSGPDIVVAATADSATPVSAGASRAVSVALSQVGKPYIWGADGPGGFDCSGLMLFAWRSAGRSLPHSSRVQFSSTRRVALSQAQPGDLIFFGHPIHHVGMVIGGGKMVEASHRGTPVRVRSMFRRDFVGVGRV